MTTSIHSTVDSEIKSLHTFFVDWFAGCSPSSDETFFAKFMDRFDPAFLLIPPAGTTLDLDDLANSIKSAHGSNPTFNIKIRNVQIRREWENHVLATYEEWQRNAKASSPPNNGRVATVLFKIEKRLKWLHVHETWLPQDIMQAGPYNF